MWVNKLMPGLALTTSWEILEKFSVRTATAPPWLGASADGTQQIDVLWTEWRTKQVNSRTRSISRVNWKPIEVWSRSRKDKNSEEKQKGPQLVQRTILVCWSVYQVLQRMFKPDQLGEREEIDDNNSRASTPRVRLKGSTINVRWGRGPGSITLPFAWRLRNVCTLQIRPAKSR